MSSSLPGYYYLVFAADADYRGESYEMPFRLELQVRGEESGAPEYADGQEVLTGTGAPLGAPVTAGAEPIEEPTDDPSAEESEEQDGATADEPDDAAQESASETADDAPGTGTLAAVGVLVAVALGCVVVAVRLLRTRRT